MNINKNNENIICFYKKYKINKKHNQTLNLTKINKLKTQCRIYWLEGCKKFCLICLRSTCSPISFNFYLSNTLLFRLFFLPQYEALSKCVRIVSPVFKWNPSFDCIESSILFWYLLASSSQSIVRSPEHY